MNSRLPNNPNGKILEVGDEGSAPGTTRKFIGLAVFLLCLFLLFSFSTKKSSDTTYTKGIENYTQISKGMTEKLAEKKLATQLAEKKVSPQSELAIQVENAKIRVNEAGQASEEAYQARKVADTEKMEAGRHWIEADESEKTATANIMDEKEAAATLASKAEITAKDDLQTASNELYTAERAMNEAVIAYETVKREEKIIESEVINTAANITQMEKNEKTAATNSKFYLVITLIGMGLGLLMTYSGIKATRAVAGRNSNYVINSQDNTFTLPYNETSYCKLTDISAVNKRVESTQRNETYYKNGKAKQRRVTDKTYYVQLVGANINGEFSFGNQGIRDRLYSSLKIGINDVRFLR
jgi:hypothetical protein